MRMNAERTGVAGLAATLLALVSAGGAWAGELFLVDESGLFVVDPGSAMKTLVGPGACDGLALSPEPSRYLYCSKSRETSNGFLYALHTDGSAMTYVTTIQGDADRGLAFNTATGLLYGTDNGDFGTIDPATGTFTLVSDLDLLGLPEPESLAADPVNNLIYGVDLDEGLLVYDVGADQWNRPGGVGIANGEKGGLAYDPDSSLLYFIETDGDLYSIDPGDLTTVHLGNVTDMDEHAGLAFLPQRDPLPDIWANGLDGGVAIRAAQSLFLTIALDMGDLEGDDAELWLLGRLDGTWYSFDLATGTWVAGLVPSRSGPTVSIPTRVMWDNSVPPGLGVGNSTLR